jgi:hypothetical protein
MDSLSHLLSTESPSCADLGLMYPNPTPKQLAAAAAYVSELEANLVAANDEVARLRLKAADRDQWQEVAMKVSEERDRLQMGYDMVAKDAVRYLEQRDEARRQCAQQQDALEAARVFITPYERLKGWNEYKEDAARKIAALAPVVAEKCA